MKNSKILIIAFALFAMNVSASVIDPVLPNSNPVLPNSKLRSEIVELIGNNWAFYLDVNECKAVVFFTVNSDNNVTVLNVISKNKECEPYLLRKLRNKKVSKTPYEINQVFRLPIRIIKSPY